MSKRIAEQSSTLVELLRWRAVRHPERQAYTFLIDGEKEGAHLTYAELDRQAQAIGALLQRLGASGERALLLYPPGLEFVAAFFGCLYAGTVAVPAYPPHSTRLRQSLSRLQAIMHDAPPFVALTTSSIFSKIEELLAQIPDVQKIRCLATDNDASDWVEKWLDPNVDSHMLAFLQYTSGSTAVPKGVMVSHGNLMYNGRMMQTAFEQTDRSTVVSWLPFYHDMGLIGNVIQSLYIGATCILMSPVAFLQTPYRWLQAISRYRAVFSGAPNFAYDLCVRKITPQQRATLDLSSWSLAFNGAEPVRDETLDRFAATFASCGFRREALYPCYGLAEATLFVSGGLKAARPVGYTVQSDALERHQVVATSVEGKDSRSLVGCGRSWLDQKILIVDPQTLIQCSPDRVGEIWVSGPNVAQGYWNRPEETQHTFGAYLADTGEGPYMRTGDLGFMKDGELFVTGRLKDLIIIRGRNHYPQDIERTVEQSHPGFRPGCGAVFSIGVDGEERLVVTQEVDRSALRNLDVDEAVRAIRSEVWEQHELPVYAVLLLNPASIAKTSSGKTQRHVCRAGFLAGTLEVVENGFTDSRGIMA